VIRIAAEAMLDTSGLFHWNLATATG